MALLISVWLQNELSGGKGSERAGPLVGLGSSCPSESAPWHSKGGPSNFKHCFHASWRQAGHVIRGAREENEIPSKAGGTPA